MKTKEDLLNFMQVNHVNFTQLVRSFSFWNGLTPDEKDAFIKGYMDKEYY